jgi:hypothetical protein
VREATIEADFRALPEPWTLGKVDLTRALPEYAIAWDNHQRLGVTDLGYELIRESPGPTDGSPCLYRRPDFYRYAFSTPLPVIEDSAAELTPDLTVPLTDFTRHSDRITLRNVQAQPDAPLVITVQELAYPGWRVEVDGQPRPIESVGGWIGVVLPPGSDMHTVHFAFRPPIFYRSALLSLLTALLCMLYLARADQMLRR